MSKTSLKAALLIILVAVIAYFGVIKGGDFKFGLDLSGGTQLIYEADTSNVAAQEEDQALQALRNVIERRVNAFGVSEPVVQVEQGGFGTGEEVNRLLVELPGITNVQEAIQTIGETPLLEFKLRTDQQQLDVNQDDLEAGNIEVEADDLYTETDLTGRFLARSELVFSSAQQTGFGGEPVVLLHFTDEGAEIFERLTTENTGEVLAVFLDGEIISAPVIQEPIAGGTAQVTGQFTPDEARELVRDLNLGALPVPIELVSTQTVGATLGGTAREAGVEAGVIGLILVGIFLLLWYRLQGLLASVALGAYLIVMLALFKFIPVVLTAAGIAGFILSIGMAVDANVLIFERIKEELEDMGERNLQEVVQDGFARAWPSIRDANFTSIITSVILFWFGTSLVKGFALVFGLGIIVSMVTAITVTRIFTLSVVGEKLNDFKRLTLADGFTKKIE